MNITKDEFSKIFCKYHDIYQLDAAIDRTFEELENNAAGYVSVADGTWKPGDVTYVLYGASLSVSLEKPKLAAAWNTFLDPLKASEAWHSAIKGPQGTPAAVGNGVEGPKVGDTVYVSGTPSVVADVAPETPVKPHREQWVLVWDDGRPLENVPHPFHVRMFKLPNETGLEEACVYTSKEDAQADGGIPWKPILVHEAREIDKKMKARKAAKNGK